MSLPVHFWSSAHLSELCRLDGGTYYSNTSPESRLSRDPVEVTCQGCINQLAQLTEEAVVKLVHLAKDKVPGHTFCGAQSDWSDPEPGAALKRRLHLTSNTTNSRSDVTCQRCLRRAPG